MRHAVRSIGSISSTASKVSPECSERWRIVTRMSTPTRASNMKSTTQPVPDTSAAAPPKSPGQLLIVGSRSMPWQQRVVEQLEAIRGTERHSEALRGN